MWASRRSLRGLIGTFVLLVVTATGNAQDGVAATTTNSQAAIVVPDVHATESLRFGQDAVEAMLTQHRLSVADASAISDQLLPVVTMELPFLVSDQNASPVVLPRIIETPPTLRPCVLGPNASLRCPINSTWTSIVFVYRVSEANGGIWARFPLLLGNRLTSDSIEFQSSVHFQRFPAESQDWWLEGGIRPDGAPPLAQLTALKADARHYVRKVFEELGTAMLGTENRRSVRERVRRVFGVNPIGASRNSDMMDGLIQRGEAILRNMQREVVDARNTANGWTLKLAIGGGSSTPAVRRTIRDMYNTVVEKVNQAIHVQTVLELVVRGLIDTRSQQRASGPP